MLSVENIYFGVIGSFGTCQSGHYLRIHEDGIGNKNKRLYYRRKSLYFKILLAFGFLPKKNSIIKMHKAVYIFYVQRPISFLLKLLGDVCLMLCINSNKREWGNIFFHRYCTTLGSAL